MRDLVLFQLNGKDVYLLQIIMVAIVILLVFFINRIGSRLTRRYGKKNRIAEKFARFVRQGIRSVVWLIGVISILEILKIDSQNILNHILYETDNITLQVNNLIAVVIIIYIIRIVVFALEYGMELRIESKKLDKGRGLSFVKIVKYLTWLIGFTIIISSLGFKVTFVIASVSALLVGVGFGLQHIFNDFFSSIIILFDGSIEVDDVVEVEGTVGRVLEIGLRVSKVLTRDNVVIIVPNSLFTGEKIINWTHNKKVTRFHVSVGVAYGSNVRLVEKILLAAANEHSEIVKDPKSFVRFNDFGDSSLDFQLYFWTANDFLVENIKSDLRFVIDEQFRNNDVVIPFPQRDLHLKTKDFQ